MPPERSTGPRDWLLSGACFEVIHISREAAFCGGGFTPHRLTLEIKCTARPTSRAGAYHTAFCTRRRELADALYML